MGLLPARSGLFLAPKVLLALMGLGTAGQTGQVLLWPEKTTDRLAGRWWTLKDSLTYLKSRTPTPSKLEKAS